MPGESLTDNVLLKLRPLFEGAHPMLSISNYLGIIVVWEIITLPLLVLFTFLMVVMTKPEKYTHAPASTEKTPHKRKTSPRPQG